MESNTTTSVHNPLEPYEEIDTSTGVKKMVKNIKEGLKKLTQPHKFEFKEIPDAHQAYLLSKYGKANNKEDLQFFVSKGYTAVELSTVIEGLTKPYLFIAFDNFIKTKENLSGSE